MPRHRIPGDIFCQGNPLQQLLPSQKEFFDTPVLIPQLDFEMQDLLTLADKAEMARFNDPGMNRSDTHLMQFVTVDRIKGVAGNGL